MNESRAIRESEPEPVKPSKLSRIKDAAIGTAVIVLPGALLAGSVYASVKMSKMQLETAKLNLETAKITQK